MLLAEITATQWILPAALLVLLVVMMIFPMLRNKKQVKQYQEMQSSLKAGDKVQTIGGIIGRILRVQEKDGVKTVFIETGDKKNKMVLEMDINAIAGPIVASNQNVVNASDIAGEEVEEEPSVDKDEIEELIEKNVNEKENKNKKSKNK